MGKSILFINEKGGAGKTTCCFNVAWELSKKNKVLIVDMDGQEGNISFYAGVRKIELDEDGEEYYTKGMYSVLNSNEKVENVIHNIRKNLDIIPATTETMNINEKTKLDKIKKFMSKVKEEYDYILIDVNPAPTFHHFLMLSVVDYVIIPVEADVLSIVGLKGITESVNQAKETTNPNLVILGIVLNKQSYQARNLIAKTKQITDVSAEKLDTKIFKSTIRDTIAVKKAVAMHVGVSEFDPKSDVANDFKELVKEIKKEMKKHEK